MPDISPAPRLSDLVSLDLLIAQHSTLLHAAKRSVERLMEAATRAEEAQHRFAILECVHQELLEKRNLLRESVASTHQHEVPSSLAITSVYS